MSYLVGSLFMMLEAINDSYLDSLCWLEWQNNGITISTFFHLLGRLFIYLFIYLLHTTNLLLWDTIYM